LSAPGLERAVAAVLRARIGRECLFVPSGRVALYLALRTWMRPGDRLLMSPLTDDVILFIVLAAGLRPVMAPVSAGDGNIDPGSVPDTTWSAVGGVLTTNLYGLPDRVLELRERCRRLGIPLLEDAAHAIETDIDGRPVGSLGTAAAFSLSKHASAGGGGVLAFSRPADRPRLERLRDELLQARPRRRLAVDVGAAAAERLVYRLRLVRVARHLRRTLGLAERSAYRMPLRAPLLRQAVAAGPDLDRFDLWTRVDLRDYRMPPRAFQLRRMLDRLHRLHLDRDRRLAGVRRLQALHLAAPGVRHGRVQPLFRVPFLVEDRDAVVAELLRRHVPVGYIYDPPLDDYAGPDFVEPSPDPEVARWWAGRVLPVDPLDPGPTLGVLRRLGTLDGPTRPRHRQPQGSTSCAP
jgi:DegT/DnrJ/EryC1/StrS aminotransferase family